MHYFNNPDHASDELELFRRFPRKTGEKVKRGTGTFGWGLQYVEILHGVPVFIFGFLGFTLSLAIAIAWTNIKNDIQGGFGIGAFLLAFVLFCATIAHIYIG